jgi:hypothetical protein
MACSISTAGCQRTFLNFYNGTKLSNSRSRRNIKSLATVASERQPPIEHGDVDNTGRIVSGTPASENRSIEFHGVEEPEAEIRVGCRLDRSGMKRRLVVLGVIAAIFAASEGSVCASGPKPVSAKKFDALAETALDAMKKRAAELNISGVAVVSYAPGDTIAGWSSRMAVVGRMKDTPSATDKGSNLLGIAYAKAAEMADTLQDSGTAKRPPMTGEFGWQGGVIARTKTGYVIVAFSGGKSAEDAQVSRSGLEVLKPAL